MGGRTLPYTSLVAGADSSQSGSKRGNSQPSGGTSRGGAGRGGAKRKQGGRNSGSRGGAGNAGGRASGQRPSGGQPGRSGAGQSRPARPAVGVAAGTTPARATDLAPPPLVVEASNVGSDDRAPIPGRARALAVAAMPALVVVVLVIAVGAAVGQLLVGLVVAVVLGACAWAGVWVGASRLLLGRVGGRFVEEQDVPRAANLVDGLCATMGLPLPQMMLIDDPFRGALVIGRNERTATLVLTTGLLRALDPVELEGVLAHELSHVKCGDMASATMAAAAVLPLAPMLSSSPELVRKLSGPGRELAADERAVLGDALPAGTSRRSGEDGGGPATGCSLGARERRNGSSAQVGLDGGSRAPCSDLDQGDPGCCVHQGGCVRRGLNPIGEAWNRWAR